MKKRKVFFQERYVFFFKVKNNMLFIANMSNAVLFSKFVQETNNK